MVFGASFTPSEIPKEEIYRGISVRKVIQLLDPATGEAVGSSITSAKLGQQVKVTLEISIPDYVSRVQIVDPLPGCLEALDDSFFNVPDNSGTWNYRWWWYYY